MVYCITGYKSNVLIEFPIFVFLRPNIYTNICRPFLRDMFVRDHQSMVLKVWGARERLAVTGISHGQAFFYTHPGGPWHALLLPGTQCNVCPVCAQMALMEFFFHLHINQS